MISSQTIVAVSAAARASQISIALTRRGRAALDTYTATLRKLLNGLST